MTYELVAVALAVQPSLNAFALIVVLLDTTMAEVYTGELAVGSLPSVVYRIVAAGVAHDNVTL
jgi:hypothetical protein